MRKGYTQLWFPTAALLVFLQVFPSATSATNAQSRMDNLNSQSRGKQSIDETLYGELLKRAQERMPVRGISTAGTTYTSAHIELVEDVVKSCNKVLSLNEQNELIYDNNEGGLGNSRIFDFIAKENPRISGKDALNSLEKNTLESRQRSAVPKVLKGNRESAQHSCNGDRPQDDEREDEHENEARRISKKKMAKHRSARFPDEEVYKNLLLRALARRPFPEDGNLKAAGNHRYTAEQNALVDDVVRTCTQALDKYGLFEVFQRLLSDLGVPEMNRHTFHNRVAAV